MDSLTSSFTPLCTPNLRPADTSFRRKEGSIHSKRPTFSPLPLEGAAWRSETGLAPPRMLEMRFFPPVSLSPPLSGIAFIKINAERRSGTLVSSDLCKNVFPSASSSFMPPVPYPPLRGTFPSRGRLAIRGEPALKGHSDIVRWMLRSVSALCAMPPCLMFPCSP